VPEVPELELGQRWAYRARRIDDLVEVEVVKLGTQKPARVQVRFVEERFEGRQEWVPPARLKVHWSGVEAFQHREALWDRMDELGIGDDPHYWAAEEVFQALIGDDVSRMEYREAGACRVTDSDRLAQLTGLDPQLWLACPDGFREGADLVVPWSITEQIVQAAANHNPNPVLEVVEQEEEKARREAIHGSYHAGRGSRGGYEFSAETCAQVDSEYGKPRRAILRRWCGAEAGDRFDELKALRVEIHRVGLVAEEAIAELRAAGRKQAAEQLARKLGTRVEELR
jgi:hypothetical protein